MMRRRFFIGASLCLAAPPVSAQERPTRFSVTGSMEQGSLATGAAPPGSAHPEVIVAQSRLRRR